MPKNALIAKKQFAFSDSTLKEFAAPSAKKKISAMPVLRSGMLTRMESV